MVMNRYLAMTAAEFQTAATLPKHVAWMACHFSSYGLGLSNLPTSLPEGSMIIINDRVPIHSHAPELILQQLLDLTETLKPSCFLLDFQRPEQEETYAVAKLLAQKLPCPVGMTEAYGEDLDCPLFLPPPPLHIPLSSYLKSWKNREIWLEISLDAQRITVTKEGSTFSQMEIKSLEEPSFCDELLHCRYHTDITENAVNFHLLRDNDQIEKLLQEAEALGITQCVGLYQQLHRQK